MAGRTILHVDMDAFFASVEQSRRPELRGRPVIVGAGPRERGVVSTCSYEARRFGVRSAMPSRTAYKLCPHAVFVPPRMDLYGEVSDLAFETFGRFTPYVEGVSVDEAFLDVTGSLHLHGGSARRLGEALRAEVRRVCGVTCSVGIAPNRLLAKIGSEENKPDGLTVMPFDRAGAEAFLAPKPVGVLWGAGRKTCAALRPYGIATCGDIQRTDEEALAEILGSAASARALKFYARGISDDRVRWEGAEDKSVSREHTFGADVPDRDEVRRVYLRLVDDVGRRFRREARWAGTARLKLRDSAFRTLTRQMPFPSPSRDDIAFRSAALSLFDAAWPEGRGFCARLVGFGVANIRRSPDGGEPELFVSPGDEAREKRERLSAALDSLRDRGVEFCRL